MSCSFNKYKDILGIPGEGIHKFTFLDTPIVDYSLSIILAMLITFFSKIPLVLTTIYVFIFSIILHTLFGVNTPVQEYLGLNDLSGVT